MRRAQKKRINCVTTTTTATTTTIIITIIIVIIIGQRLDVLLLIIIHPVRFVSIRTYVHPVYSVYGHFFRYDSLY